MFCDLVVLDCGRPTTHFDYVLLTRWVPVIAAALLALTGCTEDAGSASSESAEDSLTTKGPVIALAEEWNGYPLAGYDDASLSVRNGCLLVDGDVAFWPYGTAWDPTSREVVIREDIRLGLDDRPDLGGGAYSLDTDWSWLGADVARRVQDCLTKTGASNALVVYYATD